MSRSQLPRFRPLFVQCLRQLPAFLGLVLLASCAAPETTQPKPAPPVVPPPTPQKLSVSEDQASRAVTVRTGRLEAKFRDGRIVKLSNLLTGELVCDERLGNDALLPGGIGLVAGNIPAMSASHIPWGSTQLGQQLQGDVFSANQRFPGQKSSFRIQRTDDRSIVAVWTGLTNGKEYFADQSLSLKLTLEADGSLSMKADGSAPEGGVFGVQIPIANIIPSSRFFIPSFGGLCYDRSHPPVLMSLGGAPFVESPAVAFETQSGSVGLWTENLKFPDYYLFWGWDGKSFSLSLEHLNIMPFEPHRAISSTTWKLNVFSGGWVDAYTPYRDWYRKQFAKEFKVRDYIGWANDIRVVIDNYQATPEAFSAIASTFDPGTVLLHHWNARAPAFDSELPDWTPRQGYVDGVRLAQKHGLRTMAYVNTYCINYNSPFFVRDNLRDKFLTRKLSIYNYGDQQKPGAISEMLIGTIDKVKGGDQFAGVKDGEIMYGDPLSKGWRDYHIAQMKEWRKITGTDANYEDTAGCAGDFGNGVVDGYAGAQGSVLMLKELLGAQPDVPMASEYGPAPIAFGVKWPLNYAQVWGNEDFRRFRLHRQHPISAYLYENRQWIPVIVAETDFLKHLVTGCSDALGGMAQAPTTPEALAVDRGMPGHMVHRAKLFSKLRLTPVFSREKYPANLVCLYKDADGGEYKYFDDGKMQRMTGPDGEDLYVRVDGVERVSTRLVLPGWPARSEESVFGLDPARGYALFPKTKDNSAPPLIQIQSLSDKVAVEGYRESADFALLNLKSLDPAVKATNVKFRKVGGFPILSVNGKPVDISGAGETISVGADLPASILYSKKGFRPEPGKKIGDEARSISRQMDSQGLAIGNPVQFSDMVPASRSGRHFFSYGTKVADFLIEVPQDPKAGIRLGVISHSSKYGDASLARLYLDGKLVHERDFGSPDLKSVEHDQKPYEWLLPLGKYAGRTVLVTLSGDHKASANSDSLWMAIPELVSTDAQSFSENIVYPGRAPSAKDLVDSLNPQAWEGMVQVSPDARRDGKQGFEIYGEYATSILYKDFIPVEMDKTYVLSVWLRSLSEKPQASANFGLRMYDKDKRPIFIQNVSVCPNTETVLSAPAKKGDQELLLKKPQGFEKPQFCTVAFNIADNCGDLPNFDLSPEVKEMTEENGQLRLKLHLPLAKDYASGTRVRLHTPWGAPCYWIADEWLPAGDWKQFTATFKGEAKSGIPIDQFWRGTRFVRPFVWFGNWNRKPEAGAKVLINDLRFTVQ